MKTAHFQYKCRRCGEIEENPHCGIDHALLHLINAIGEYKKESPQAPELLSLHDCKDGGMGVSDLVGYSVSDD